VIAAIHRAKANFAEMQVKFLLAAASLEWLAQDNFAD
jgi:hypothetical protein